MVELMVVAQILVVDVETQVVVVRHVVVEMDLKGSMANCPYVTLLEMGVVIGACGGEKGLYVARRVVKEFSHLDVPHLRIASHGDELVRNGDVLSDEVMLCKKRLLGMITKEFSNHYFLGIPPHLFDFKTMIEFDYKSRTNGFIMSEKRLETYGSKGWKHVVCFNEGWSDESSFMEETTF
ncbi:hypothetical protein Tco_0110309 [Tanacetum coccineum]